MKKPNYTEISVEEQETFRNWLRGVLQTEIVTLKFIKKDGTERLMKGTLKKGLTAKVIGKENSNNSDTVIRVTDIELGEWRSIRFDSIKEISFTIGNK